MAISVFVGRPFRGTLKGLVEEVLNGLFDKVFENLAVGDGKALGEPSFLLQRLVAELVLTFCCFDGLSLPGTSGNGLKKTC